MDKFIRAVSAYNDEWWNASGRFTSICGEEALGRTEFVAVFIKAEIVAADALPGRRTSNLFILQDERGTKVSDSK
jgi:hypothetical protein